jgi:hypothetical protein
LPGALFALRFVPVRARLAVAEGDERPVFPLAALVDRVTDFALAPPLERVADFAPVTRLVPDREPARLVAMLTIFARNMPWAPKWGLTPRGLTPPLRSGSQVSPRRTGKMAGQMARRTRASRMGRWSHWVTDPQHPR